MKRLLLAVLSTLFLLAGQARAMDVITLTPNNTLSLRVAVDEASTTALIDKLESMTAKTVYLYINSPGGSIDDGFKIMNAIKNSGKHVVCIADYAASMAFSILQSCDERYVVEGAIIMQHQASAQLKGPIHDERRELDFIDKIAGKLNEGDAKRLGIPLKDFQDKIEHEWWMFDKEALENHAADKMVGVRCSPMLAASREVTTVQTLFGPVSLVWSSCPLETAPLKIDLPQLGGKKQGEDGQFKWLNWKENREVR